MKKLLVLLSLFAVAAQAADLQEVVVTAQRKAENIKDVPISVSSLSEDDLADRQIDSVKQVLQNTPNLLGNNNLATQSALTVFIRGVGTTENLATAETSVGVYVDGVYIARQGFNNLGLLDVESVEILRGPQGVLYGRNTNGGAVRVTHNKPQFTSGGEYSASYGAVNYLSGSAIVNTPINDNLAIRFNLTADKYDGFVYAPNLNKNVNDGNNFGGRLALRYLNSVVDVNLSSDYSKLATNGNFQTDIAGILTPKPTDLFTTQSAIDASNINETYGAALTVKIGSVDTLEFQSITGYRKLDQLIYSDVSGQPVSMYTFYQDQKSEHISQEFQVVGKISPTLSYVGGLYYFDEHASVYLSDLVKTTPSAAVLGLYKRFTVDVSNYAAYGQLEYNWNKFTLAVGGRYTSEDRKLDIVQTSNNPSTLFNYNTAALKQRGVATSKTYSDTTPRVSVSYKVNDVATGYLSYTEGFRAGGWTGRSFRVDQYINFNPENVTTTELGIKASGNAWRVNAAVFNTDYTNLFNTLTVNGVYTVQTADARIKGFEAEGNYLVTDWLTVYGNVGVLDGEYKSPRPANLAAELQRLPKLQGKVGIKGEWHKFVLNASAYHVSEYRLTPANLAVTAPALAGKGLDVTGNFTTYDLSLSWVNNNTTVTAGCTNCTDKHYVEGGAYIGQYVGAWMGESQMWSLTLSQKF